MKSVLQIIIGICCFGIACFMGYFLHHHLKSIGVTFITVDDIAGCYLVSLLIWGAVGIGAILAIDYKKQRRR